MSGDGVVCLSARGRTLSHPTAAAPDHLRADRWQTVLDRVTLAAAGGHPWGTAVQMGDRLVCGSAPFSCSSCAQRGRRLHGM